MPDYKATSTNSKNFRLTALDTLLGELVYSTWYSFKAEIILPGNAIWHVEPKGFWESIIEVKQQDLVLLNFKMGWKGIIINTHFNGEEKNYLLQMKGLLNSKYVLTTPEQEELVAVQVDFKWKTFNFDFNLATSPEIEKLAYKELFLLTIIHCTNYYITMMTAAGV